MLVQSSSGDGTSGGTKISSCEFSSQYCLHFGHISFGEIGLIPFGGTRQCSLPISALVQALVAVLS